MTEQLHYINCCALSLWIQFLWQQSWQASLSQLYDEASVKNFHPLHPYPSSLSSPILFPLLVLRHQEWGGLLLVIFADEEKQSFSSDNKLCGRKTETVFWHVPALYPAFSVRAVETFLLDPKYGRILFVYIWALLCLKAFLVAYLLASYILNVSGVTHDSVYCFLTFEHRLRYVVSDLKVERKKCLCPICSRKNSMFHLSLGEALAMISEMRMC